MPGDGVDTAVRALVEGRSVSELADRYSEDVDFAAHLPGQTLRAGDRRSAHQGLRAWGPWAGKVSSWSVEQFGADGSDPGGWDCQVQWLRTSDGVTMRQGHYIQTDGKERVTRHVVLPQRAAATEPPPGEPGPILAALLGAALAREPMSGGHGGAFVERLRLSNRPSTILKYVIPGDSWHSRATKDPGREALLFSDDTLDRLPKSIGHAVNQVESYGAGWVVVMRDVGAHLPSRPVNRDAVRAFLAALRGLHQATAGVARDYLATTADRWALWWPRTCEQEFTGVDEQPKLAARGWDLVDSTLPADVAEIVKWIPAHEAEWVESMDTTGSCVLHGDAHFANLAVEKDRFTMLDWGIATHGTPATEGAWLANFTHHYAFGLEELLDDVRDVWDMQGDLNFDRALLALASGLLPASLVGAYDYPDPAHRREMKAKVAAWIRIVRGSLARV